jgi:putative transposase
MALNTKFLTLPGQLEAQIDAFVEHYSHHLHRYHASLNNLTLLR